MMTMKLLPLVVLLAGLAPRIEAIGLLGETAPPLVVKQWVQGGPVVLQPGTNIYVVEIWTTTSASSRACITNLNALQSRFKTNGVVLVGLSDEPAERIQAFVQHGGGTNIAYAIAADDKRQTVLSYMNLVQERGVPFAFVVGTNGNVIWYGPPMGGLNQALRLIVAGQYDFERFQKHQLDMHQMEQYLTLARRGDFRAKPAGETLLANRTNDPALLCDLAYQISTDPQLRKRDFALAGAALDQADKLSATNRAAVMVMRAVWLFASGKPDAGLALANQALVAAQSPRAKADVQVLIRSMQAQLAEAKTNQSRATPNVIAGTNPPVPAPAPAPAPKPNPGAAADTQPPAAK